MLFQQSPQQRHFWLLSLTDKDAKPRNITCAAKPRFTMAARSITRWKVHCPFRMQKQPGTSGILFRLALSNATRAKSPS